MAEEKKENTKWKIRRSRTTDGKEDIGGMTFTVSLCQCRDASQL